MEVVHDTARASRWWRRACRQAGGWWEATPDAGIYIGSGYLATAAIAATTVDYRLLASRVDPLPGGAVVPSPVESNIRQPHVVIDRLKEAAGMSRQGEVALSLPDPTVRVAVLELAQFPSRRLERHALFQHHLEQLFLTSLGRCRFACQRLSPAAPSSPGGRHRVLVSAIREEILEEYESVARAAGLLPAVVDISAFHLYNLYEGQLSASLPSQQCALFLNLFDQNFTIILADRDGPRFIRIKALPSVLAEADLLARVLAEVDASIRVAQVAIGGDDEPQAVARLFFFSDRPLHGLAQEMAAAHQVESTRLHQNGRAIVHGGAPSSLQSDGQPDGAEGDVAGSQEPPALTTALAAAVSARGGRRGG